MAIISEAIIYTGEQVFPDEARATTARLLDQLDQPSLLSAFFHYQDGRTDSTPALNVAPVSFGSHRNGFTLIAINDEGRSILSAALPFVLEAWQKHLKKPIKVDLREHDSGARPVPFKMRYRLRKAVICKKPEQHQLRGPDVEEQQRFHSIGSVIKRSLLSFAQAAGIELPEPEKIKVSVVDHGPAFYATVAHASKRNALGRLGYKDVDFDINLDLTGYWLLGNLRSNGYGHLKCGLQRKHQLDKRVAQALAEGES